MVMLSYCLLFVGTGVLIIFGYGDNLNFEMEFSFLTLIQAAMWYSLKFTRFRELSPYGGWYLILWYALVCFRIDG